MTAWQSSSHTVDHAINMLLDSLQPEDHLIVDWRADAQLRPFDQISVLDFCHSRLLLSLPFSNIMSPPTIPARWDPGRKQSGQSGASGLPGGLSLFNSINTRDINVINRRESDKRDFEPDKWQFVGSLQDDSRAYRNLAMELIFLCRFFVQAHEQSSNSSIRLRK